MKTLHDSRGNKLDIYRTEEGAEHMGIIQSLLTTWRMQDARAARACLEAGMNRGLPLS